ncbi:H-type small acid-soluble spore protein [Alicyclobacillus sp. TC]|nr:MULTISPECIES: H-type small acid-soluble spore protein [Alicyclobacillus]QRF23357.1 H-type small acid-soluble spore protein [Alicyclobacillus sp. TC]
MHIQRAVEIASSPDMVHVTCQGVPIYIQHVDEKNEMCRVYPLDQPNNERDVHVSALEEHRG